MNDLTVLFNLIFSLVSQPGFYLPIVLYLISLIPVGPIRDFLYNAANAQASKRDESKLNFLNMHADNAVRHAAQSVKYEPPTVRVGATSRELIDQQKQITNATSKRVALGELLKNVDISSDQASHLIEAAYNRLKKSGDLS
jgi:hypothetical protein